MYRNPSVGDRDRGTIPALLVAMSIATAGLGRAHDISVATCLRPTLRRRARLAVQSEKEEEEEEEEKRGCTFLFTSLLILLSSLCTMVQSKP